jgi:hypothetical protein
MMEKWMQFNKLTMDVISDFDVLVGFVGYVGRAEADPSRQWSTK